MLENGKAVRLNNMERDWVRLTNDSCDSSDEQDLANERNVEPSSIIRADAKGDREDASCTQNMWRRYERWYILLVFGLLSFMNMFIWNAFGPIADVAQHIFGWTDTNIAMLYNWCSITVLCVTFPAASFVDRFGIRTSAVLSAIFVLCAAGCRCVYLHDQPEVNTIMQNISAVFNGLPVLLGAPSMVSALWFPAKQRTIATSFILLLNSLGYALAFVIEPAVVHNEFTQNHTFVPDSDIDGLQNAREEARRRLFDLFYVTFGITAFLTVCTMVHFPSQPRFAPSASAAGRREPFRVGIRQLACSCTFWMLLISYSLVVGIAGSWMSLIYIVLRPLGTHSELDAGLLGLITNLVQALLCVALAQYADSNIRHSKKIILTGLTLSAALYAFFGLMANGYIPINVVLLDCCIVIATSIAFGLIPVYLELTNEVCYPVSESLCSLTLGCGNQLTSSLFYSTVSTVTALSPGVANPHNYRFSSELLFWTPLASITLSIIPLVFFRPRFKRAHLDLPSTTSGARRRLQAAADRVLLLSEDDQSMPALSRDGCDFEQHDA